MYTSNADNEGNRKMDNAKTAIGIADLFEAVEALNEIGHGYYLDATAGPIGKRNRMRYRVMQWNSAHDSASAKQQVLPLGTLASAEKWHGFATMRELHKQITTYIVGHNCYVRWLQERGTNAT